MKPVAQLRLECLIDTTFTALPFVSLSKLLASADRCTGPLHSRTLEIWDDIALTPRALAEGVIVDGIDIRREGEQVAHLPYDGTGETAHPHGLMLEQNRTQRLLLDVLAERGIEVRWGARLVGLAQEADGVVAQLEDGSTIRASYCVGADGGSSTVRHLIEVPLAGGTYDTSFFLADLTVQSELLHTHAHLNFTGRSTTALLPLPGSGRFRVIGNLDHQSTKDSSAGYGRSVSRSEVERLLQANALPLVVRDIGWSTTYRSHHRVADAYRRGRVFIAGDAAHLHSPAGGLGLNTGVADAANLTWKLAECLRGAPSILLDTYESERRAVAMTVVATSDRLFTLQADRRAVYAFARRQVLPRAISLLMRTEGGHRLAFNQLSGTHVSYAGRGLANPATKLGSLSAGDRLPDLAVDRGGSFTLHAMLQPAAHTLLVVRASKADASWLDLLERLAARRGFLARRLPIGSAEATIGGAGPVAVWVRPDRHTGWVGSDLADLARHLERFLGP